MVVVQGRKIPYLDLFISLAPFSQNDPLALFYFHTSLYDKRDAMPLFANCLRFPHPQTKLLDSVKFNVLYSQLIRFARLHSRPCVFRAAVVKYITQMITAGYPRTPLFAVFARFKHKYAAIYLATHEKSLTQRSINTMWKLSFAYLRQIPR
jgi:hypothetical protein